MLYNIITSFVSFQTLPVLRLKQNKASDLFGPNTITEERQNRPLISSWIFVKVLYKVPRRDLQQLGGLQIRWWSLSS